MSDDYAMWDSEPEEPRSYGLCENCGLELMPHEAAYGMCDKCFSIKEWCE